MMRVLLLLFSLQSIVGFSQLKSYDIESIPELQKNEPRPVVVFLYADWCRYCKAMENTTFKKQDIVEKLNNDFYFVRFDGEQRESVTLGEKIYNFKPSGNETGMHELAMALGTIEGQVNYPTLVVVNERFDILYQYAGYMKTQEVETLLSIVIEKGL
ncbi:MAG: thioredoxin fold domain-containing protein [Fulvivirga sp.]